MAVATPKKGSLFRRQHLFAGVTLTPIMVYMMFFTMVPMVWGILITFFRYSPTRAGEGFLGLGGANPFVGINNYLDLFANTPTGQLFRISLKNTLIFSLLYLPLNLIVTLPLAVLIESVSSRIKSFFRTIYFLPTVTSAVAVSLVWGVIYHPTFGLLNLGLRALGFNGFAWLSDPNTRVLGIPLPMICVLITYLWSDMGYNIVIFMAGLQGIPDVYHEAAVVDGANAWQRFRYITLPLLRSTLTFVMVMTMLSSWQVFVLFFVMTNRGGPANLTRVLVLHIYETAFRYQEMGLAATVAMVLFLIIMITTLIQLKLLRKDWEY
ncbi:MAG TPA: sugar ABC transporter permease [Anaerolinea thermolimosa]|uniref:Carbohydrate ABC transporter membrane protein 1, CUT1 family n=1 Tax=Anaerolinea thermolimosa TaxID=229919 RepID=A0A3D1JGH5_9CHLR|nr:sugar ABC transporter permease [Anaerolinea thermolimosa]GAP08656.1 carbohydrate ABC transporter membrane protein 1, CUT1 family [Anaerolinea thermolimosa]HCE17690.1 sugar ABC transporter permease [Anaerolinea thermolimosa]